MLKSFVLIPTYEINLVQLKTCFMKKYLALIFLILNISMLNAQVWEWSNPKPTGNNTRGIFFINATTGYIVGDYGTILKTTDMGATWTCQNSGTSTVLYDVHFVDQDLGYVVGPSTVLKTTNGGITWIQMPQVYGLFIGVDFPTANVGYVISNNYGGNVSISKTIDGGLTWNPLSAGNFGTLLSLYFINQDIGFIGGQDASLNGVMRRTTDGGITWTDCWHSASWGAIMGFDFTDSNNGFAVGTTGKLFRTADGGINWTLVTTPTTVDLISVSFPDAMNGYICGDYGGVLKSVDGGLTWSVKTVNSNTYYYSDICYPTPGTGFIIGWQNPSPDNGLILSSTDSGTTYTSMITGTRQNLTAISFPDAANGYVVGDSGTIVKTMDAGDSWNVLSSGTLAHLSSVAFQDVNTGFVVGSSGTILKTTNGGAAWQTQVSGTNQLLNAVAFENANTGWAVGDWGTILKTTNGGASWIPQVSNTSRYLKALSVVDASTVYTVGTYGTILKTVDGGSTWTSIANSWPQYTLNGVCFLDETTGFVVGDGGLILKTTNGGISWISCPVTDYTNLHSVYFMDYYNGYSVGESGIIEQTTDGGLSWWHQFSGTPRHLKGVCITSGFTGFSAGDYGTILRTTGIGVWVANRPVSGRVNVYPNPAKNTISIDIKNIPDKSCKIEITDIRGIRIFETISSENKITIDVEKYPVGIYLVKLSTNVSIYFGKFLKI